MIYQKRGVCVITGVGPGNGRAISAKFASEGFSVAMLARRAEPIEAFAAEIEGASAYPTDVTDVDALRQTLAKIQAELGPISVFVHNAGSGHFKKFMDIEVEDLHNACAMTYPEAYRSTMSGQLIKEILEDVADNLFNTDPYYQQGGDMVRVGGLGYRIDVSKPQGERITEMTLLKTGEMIDPTKTYQVAGWASVNEGTEGPKIWDVVESHIAKQGTISLDPNNSVKVVGT